MKLSASEHTVPQDSINCAVGLERDTERGGHVIITIRVHSSVQSLIVLKSFLVRHFHGPINLMEVHKIRNYV